MMRFDVRTNVNDLVRDLGAVATKQAPYAVRNATDADANDAGQALRNVMRQRFRTSPQGWRWIEHHIRVLKTGQRIAAREIGRVRTSRAGGGDMRAWVGIIPPASKGEAAGWERYRGSFIAAMEEGGPTPGPRRFGGSASGALSDYGRYPVPVARYTDRPRFPLRMWPVNLGLSSRQSIEGGMRGGHPRGKHRTFLVPIANAPGHSMIFQRFGRGKGSDVMPLFWVTSQTRLPARRYFFPTVQLIVNTRTDVHLRASLDRALFGRGAYRG